jgi:hypothetical protein
MSCPDLPLEPECETWGLAQEGFVAKIKHPQQGCLFDIRRKEYQAGQIRPGSSDSIRMPPFPGLSGRVINPD